jgi:hypothetical protein
LETLAYKGTRALQVQLVHKEMQDPRERQGQKDQLDPKEQRVRLEQQDQRAQQGNRVQLEMSDQLVVQA